MLVKHFSTFLAEELQKQSGTQMGSNEGGIHIDTETGTKHYVKTPETDEQARVEVAAAKLYKHAGLDTLDPEIIAHNGRTAVKTAWNDSVGRHSLQGLQADAQGKNAHHVALAHHMAVITNNRDVVGLEYDNLLKHKNGGIVSADQGASFNFRAMGEQKDFDRDIHPLLNGFKNQEYASGQVFTKLSPEVMKSAAKQIREKLTDQKIDDALAQHGLQKHSAIVKDRRDALLKHYGA
jgi:hypothetical protein